ncbi:MAG: hypothetical protein ACP5FL_09655 [Thermoplasmatota archaeon]
MSTNGSMVWKGLLCLSIVFLLAASGVMHAASGDGSGDQLDQEQTQRDGGLACLFEDEFAQGFIPGPGMDILTRIELLITRNETAVPGLQIAIRETVDGGNLALVDVEQEDVTAQVYEWFSLDLPDIHVTPGETYYIVWTGWHGGTAEKTYYWGYGDDDPYPEAHSYYYDQSDDEWHRFDSLREDDIDFCFRTYGDTNQPPAVPEQPEGESYLQPGEAYGYSTTATDPENNKIRYCFDWDDGTDCTWTSLYQSGAEATATHTFHAAGDHDIRVKAADEHGKESSWSDSYRVFVVDKPPEAPSITGPTTGKAGVSYIYNMSANEPNMEDVRFSITWGDGTEEVTEYYASGATAAIPHTWDSEGSYTVTVRAENSKVSEPTLLQVSMPKSRALQRPCFLDRLPPLLARLMETLLPWTQ